MDHKPWYPKKRRKLPLLQNISMDKVTGINYDNPPNLERGV